MTDDSKPDTPANDSQTSDSPARSDTKLPTAEIDRIAAAAARELSRSNAPAGDPDPLAAVKISPLGQMATLLASLTGLPPRAVFVVLLLIGLQTGLLQQYFPTLRRLDQTAAEAAKEQVEADELKVHARMNKLDESYRTGCDSQQAAIDKNSAALLQLAAKIAVLDALLPKNARRSPDDNQAQGAPFVLWK